MLVCFQSDHICAWTSRLNWSVVVAVLRRHGLNKSAEFKMSKGDTLRRFVADRLAALTQEIFAVFDGVVADYEEEASGCRRELERQRRQLEVLLQGQLRSSGCLTFSMKPEQRFTNQRQEFDKLKWKESFTHTCEIFRRLKVNLRTKQAF